MRVLMLLPVMARGYGLPEVVNALCLELADRGVECHVAATHSEGSFPGLNVHASHGSPDDVQQLVDGLGADAVIAHGSPFFEILPHLTGVTTIAYEHGEPPALYFPDADVREERARTKRQTVYGSVDHVVAISEFVRQDIGWPSATVIRNGCDHLPDPGSKPWIPSPRPADPLRIGLLMRLGHGEAMYKGNDLLPLLRRKVESRGVKASWEVMGRGDTRERDSLDAQGFRVHLNATNAEREEFLRGVDVFVTLSKWEGCNLPLIEAAAVGTPGLALDTGAHPEYGPLVFSTLDAMATQIQAYSEQPHLIANHGELCYRYVRSGLKWSDAADRLLLLLRDGGVRRKSRTQLAMRRVRLARHKALLTYRYEGGRAVVRKTVARARRKPAPGGRS